MNVIVLGYIDHPYTKAFLGECQERRISVKALVQRVRVDYPPEVVLQRLKAGGSTKGELLKRALSMGNIRRGINNPRFALGFLVRLIFGKQDTGSDGVSWVGDLQDNAFDFKGLVVKTVDDFNSPKAQQVLRNLQPDLVILAPAAQIIKKSILGIPKIGTLNAHQGLLPKYRGMNVLEYAILSGDDVGISVHFVDGGVDTGDIILRRQLDMSSITTLETLYGEAIRLSVEALADTIEMIGRGDYRREMQAKEDGKQYYTICPALQDIVRSKIKEA